MCSKFMLTKHSVNVYKFPMTEWREVPNWESSSYQSTINQFFNICFMIYILRWITEGNSSPCKHTPVGVVLFLVTTVYPKRREPGFLSTNYPLVTLNSLPNWGQRYLQKWQLSCKMLDHPKTEEKIQTVRGEKSEAR